VLTVYSTTWCGYCRRLTAQLSRENIPFEVVDIEADPQAAEYVMSVNGGNQTVPTVRFPDGSALTNPGLPEVRARLARLALS
jgi:mycoredoxin